MRIVYYGSKDWPILDQKLLPYLFIDTYHSWEQSIGNRSGFIIGEFCVLPFREYKNFLFNSIQFLHPPLDFSGQAMPPEQEKHFLDRLIEYIKKEKICASIIPPFLMDVFQTVPKNAVYTPLGNYFIDLENQSIEMIFSNFRKNYKLEIKKAESLDFTILNGVDQFPIFYKMYANNHESQGIAFDSFSYIEKLTQKLGDENCVCSVLYYQGIPQCGLIFAFTKHSGIYLYGGNAAKIASPGFMKLLQYKAIQFLKEKHVKKYIVGACRLGDLSGTKFEGIQAFKKRFGCELKEGFIWKMDFSKSVSIYRNLRVIGLKVIRKPFYSDIIDFERKRLKIES